MEVKDKIVKQKLEQLEQILEIKNTSQAKFANEIGVSRQTLNEWLNGKREPSMESWLKILDYLEG